MISPAKLNSFLGFYENEIARTIVPEPEVSGHRESTITTILRLVPIVPGMKILDVGCGQGVARLPFEGLRSDMELNLEWHGVTRGPDYQWCAAHDLPVDYADMHDLPYDAGSFDLLWCRHVIEHSFAPLFALREWRRVSRRWCVVVTPAAPHFAQHPNHLTIMPKETWEYLFALSGWKIAKEDAGDPLHMELRWLLEKED